MANNTTRVHRSDEGFVRRLIEPLFDKLPLHRTPDVIASPRTEVEVVDLMREASQQGWKVAVRSGGHSWIASSVRSGGLLLDMSAFNSISIDATTRTAKVGPAVRSAELVKALAAHGLVFPVGHRGTPGIGGFLLGGGIGWNWGHWKPACFSVRSVRVVMADGRLVVASESENSELLWLARGSGPGFPGVITEFEIKCQTRPADTRVSWLFDLDSLNQVMGWVVKASRNLPSNVVVAVSTLGSSTAVEIRLRVRALLENGNSGLNPCPKI
jgi:FAD/FMN-containing dehydrogenase